MNIHLNDQARRLLLAGLEAEYARFLSSEAFCDRIGDAANRAMWQRQIDAAMAVLIYLRDKRASVTITMSEGARDGQE